MKWSWLPVQNIIMLEKSTSYIALMSCSNIEFRTWQPIHFRVNSSTPFWSTVLTIMKPYRWQGNWTTSAVLVIPAAGLQFENWISEIPNTCRQCNHDLINMLYSWNYTLRWVVTVAVLILPYANEFVNR